MELTEIVSPTRARARLRTNLPERLNGAATPHHAAPVSRLFGLDHLQGRRVQVLADGTVQPEVVVGDASSAPWATCEWGAGEIELPRPTALVHAGLGYVSDLSPMKPELPDGLGPSQGRIKRVALGAVRLHNSLGLKAGSGEDSLERVPFEDERMGAAAPLFSGDKAVSLEAEPSPDAALLLRQDLPLPCTVLAVMLKLEVMAP
ncbi:hypothetical protein [Desulfohalovibrio reitneri]|uniref:hypothetical protein n=1 Tax=Desulfohalovibrio reitneri TaxID=1307759 RepID=UPI0004A6B333|nr:hypothetical protein [Desulfohalovibrio reitneri]